jgi:hypothetical protein
MGMHIFVAEAETSESVMMTNNSFVTYEVMIIQQNCSCLKKFSNTCQMLKIL